MFFTDRMGYAFIALVALLMLGLLGRVINRRLQPAAFPASELLRRAPLLSETATESDIADLPEALSAATRGTQGTTVKLQPQAVIAAPGAPNTDVPTDRHVSARGTATITRRTGRRRSTTSSTSATL